MVLQQQNARGKSDFGCINQESKFQYCFFSFNCRLSVYIIKSSKIFLRVISRAKLQDKFIFMSKSQKDPTEKD